MASGAHHGLHVARGRRPFLHGLAIGDGPQFPLQNAPPGDNARIRAAKELVVPIRDAALSRLHRDVLHAGEKGMAHVLIQELAAPDVLDDIQHGDEVLGFREHLAALGVLPLLAVYAARMQGGPCRLPDAIIAGLIAGLVIVLKPHFALAALCPLLAVVARTGTLRPAFQAENWVILCLCIGYVGLVALRYPDFFTILPMLVDAYVAIKRPLREIAMEPWFLLGLFIVGGVLVVGRRACLQALIALPLCASLGFTGAYLIQMKGFLNHGLPGVSMALLAAGALAAPALADLRLRGGTAPLWLSMRRAVLFGLFPVLIGAPTQFGAMLQVTDWEEHKGLLPAVQRLAPAQPRMISLSGQLDVGFPLVRRAGGVWVGRSHSLWLAIASMTLIDAGVGDDVYLGRLATYVDLDARSFREDVMAGRPDVILVDDDPRTTKAMAHPDIAGALVDYAPRETVGDITLWMRKP